MRASVGQLRGFLIISVVGGGENQRMECGKANKPIGVGKEPKMKWHLFDKSKGYHQKRPPQRKDVLVILEKVSSGLPRSVAVGYMKNSGGDKQYPYFVIPGIGGTVIAWSDCLPEGFFESILPFTTEMQ